jgi:formylmethanofuran dehydrogenase subunit C
VKPLVLTLRARPEQRLDLSPIVPHLLAGKSAADIAALAVNTTRQLLSVGDVFRVRMGDPRQIRIEGGCDRLDLIGHAMRDGEILVEGDAGCQAGRLMQGGRLVISGHAGPWAASGMKGGYLEIGADAGERLGGPLAGEMAGMRGGVVVVRGDAGARAGDRMRRGTIVIEGRAGAYAGSRMIAGSLIVRGAAGALPGYLMRRGTIVLGAGSAEVPPTFLDCGLHELVAMRLMARFVEPLSKPAAAVFRGPLRRLAGDMAVLGKGEILVAEKGG